MKLLRLLWRPLSRLRSGFRAILVLGAIIGVNVPPAMTFAGQYQHQQLINSDEYKATNGHWQTIELPEGQQINAIHAAMLPTGKLLLVAGSGNDRDNFEAGTFQTLVYDPATGASRLVPTPADLFCAGHSFLADGNLLIAGGTLRYEILDGEVEYAGGTMTIKNENPDKGINLPSGTQRDGLTPAEGGTRLVGPNGKVYLTDSEVNVPPAQRTPVPGGPDVITASEQQVFVVALEPGPDSIVDEYGQYTVEGLGPEDVSNVYGLAEDITLEKQDYQGIRDTYEFNPWTEAYERVGDMAYGRWYPTLVTLPNGQVLASSGLDQSGVILDGQTEIYDPATQAWTERDDLRQYFPTYPAIFQTEQPDRLFYSGSSTGYGPEDRGRVPGFWSLADNSFQPVAGLRDANMMETSTTTWAGPVNRQRLMVIGGGGVGESPLSTNRIDLIDLAAPDPHYVASQASLLQPTRYPSVATLPTDDILITGGARDYRGKGGSDNFESYLYHPGSDRISQVADHEVGRNYHSSAILLPDGRVLTVGSDPLYGNPENSKVGKFENRLEIYSPPYLFRADGQEITRPVITDRLDPLRDENQFYRGSQVGYEVGIQVGSSPPRTDVVPDIRSARLIWPSAVTHVTDPNARSVDINADQNKDGSITVTIPTDPAIAPSGWYMLFLIDADGVPSIGQWVHLN